MKENNIRFIHIPKCGGTSIKGALDLQTGHQTLKGIEDSIKTHSFVESNFVFCFVRNPFDRFISFYQNHYDVNRDRMKDIELGWEEWFEEVFVAKNTKWRYKEEFFWPCFDWLTLDGTSIDVDFVGKLENIQKDFKDLCYYLGIKAELPHKNSSVSRGCTYTKDMVQLITDIYRKDLETWYPHLIDSYRTYSK